MVSGSALHIISTESVTLEARFCVVRKKLTF